MPPRRLLVAVIASLCLHALVIAGPFLFGASKPPPRPRINAQLRPAEAIATRVVDPLLKNTIADAARPTEAVKAPLSRKGAGVPVAVRQAETRAVRSAQLKIAKLLFYPEEARAQGLEGDVTLLLILDPQGKVLDARVAASSGHSVLDDAAVRAAFASGHVDAAGAEEMVLPVLFRLQ